MTDAQQMAATASAILGAIEHLPVLQGLNGPTMAAALHTAAASVEQATTAQAQIESMRIIFDAAKNS